MLKLMLIPQTPAGMAATALHAHLANVHGPLVLKHPEVSGGFRRYVHHYADRAIADPVLESPPLGRDALTIICFADLEALQASIDNDVYRQVIQPDEDNIRDPIGTLNFQAREVVIRDGPQTAGIRIFHFRSPPPGVDVASASNAWCERVRFGLESAEPCRAIARYVHNIIASPDGPYDGYAFVDELWIDNSVPCNWDDVRKTLSDAEIDLINASATRSLTTMARVFLS